MSSAVNPLRKNPSNPSQAPPQVSGQCSTSSAEIGCWNLAIQSLQSIVPRFLNILQLTVRDPTVDSQSSSSSHPPQTSHVSGQFSRSSAEMGGSYSLIQCLQDIEPRRWKVLHFTVRDPSFVDHESLSSQGPSSPTAEGAGEGFPVCVVEGAEVEEAVGSEVSRVVEGGAEGSLVFGVAVGGAEGTLDSAAEGGMEGTLDREVEGEVVSSGGTTSVGW